MATRSLMPVSATFGPRSVPVHRASIVPLGENGAELPGEPGEVDVEIADIDAANWAGTLVGVKPLIPGWQGGLCKVTIDRRAATATMELSEPQRYPTGWTHAIRAANLLS